VIAAWLSEFPAYTAEAVLAMPWFRFNNLALARRPELVDAAEAVAEAEGIVSRMQRERRRLAEEPGP